MARIGLIDVDGGKNFPNLALMKISAWHKAKGDLVEWYFPFSETYDRVYMSKVFSFSPDYDEVINAKEVVRGGSGYCIELVNGREVFHKERDIELPAEVEHIYPDYSLYPRLTANKAYGFLSRGCPRGCDFCIVGKKEGRCARKVADLSEFWHGQKEVILCDPNILACREWEDLLGQLAESKAVVNFNQGLDARMLTAEKVEALNKVKFYEIHFAWDNYADKDKILPKLKMFSDLTTFQAKHNKVVYVLTHYGSTMEQDLERIYTLRDLGFMPYVTIYDKAHAPQETRRLQRWCNNRFVFGACPDFNDYR